MTSTKYNVGLTNSEKSSSRVLKPPGGGHSNIFGPVESTVNNPRQKYDQQNSSNINFCVNSPDPNVLVEQIKQEINVKSSSTSTKTTTNDEDGGKSSERIESSASNDRSSQQETSGGQQRGGGRVPPGGFSSGLW